MRAKPVAKRKGERDDKHVCAEDRAAGHQIQKGVGDPAVEELQQGIPLRFHRVKVIGLGVQAGPAQQHVDEKDPEGDHQCRQQRAGQIPEAWPVQAEAHDGQPLDDDHEMDAVVAQHPGQQETVSVKAVGGHEQGHQRPQRGKEKAEAQERPALFQHRDGDEDHIDVAQVQGQLPPPVEAPHGRRNAAVILVRPQGIFIEEETQKGHGAGRHQHRLFRLLAFFRKG